MRLFLCFLMFLLVFNCSEKDKEVNVMTEKGNFEKDYKIGKWTYEFKDKSYDVDWRIHETDSVKLNILNQWIPVNEKGIVFKSLIDAKRSDLYFLINSYTQDEITIDEFLKLSLEEAKDVENSNEFTYELYKLDLENDDNGYFVKYYLTNEINEEIIIYMMLIEKENTLYNFLFRTFDNHSLRDVNFKIFGDVIMSFKMNDKKILTKTDEIMNLRQISFEDLKGE